MRPLNVLDSKLRDPRRRPRQLTFLLLLTPLLLAVAAGVVPADDEEDGGGAPSMEVAGVYVIDWPRYREEWLRVMRAGGAIPGVPSPRVERDGVSLEDRWEGARRRFLLELTLQQDGTWFGKTYGLGADGAQNKRSEGRWVRIGEGRLDLDGANRSGQSLVEVDARGVGAFVTRFRPGWEALRIPIIRYATPESRRR